MQEPGYRIVAHTAEVAMEISAASWAEFYLHAALGLREIYCPVGRPRAIDSRPISIHQATPEDALVEMLNSLIYLVSAERWIFTSARVPADAGPTDFELALDGGPMGSGDDRAVRIVGEIKSATFSDLRVIQVDGRISATVVLDV